MNEERWLPCVGFEGRYDVSDHGRVRSWVGRGTGEELIEPFVMRLKPRQRDGIVQAGLTDEKGHQRTVPVGKLVLEAFVGKTGRGWVTTHIDNNNGNDHLRNLKWEHRSTVTARRWAQMKTAERKMRDVPASFCELCADRGAKVSR